MMLSLFGSETYLMLLLTSPKMLAAYNCLWPRVEVLAPDSVHPERPLRFGLRDTVEFYSFFSDFFDISCRAVNSATGANHSRTGKTA